MAAASLSRKQAAKIRAAANILLSKNMYGHVLFFFFRVQRSRHISRLMMGRQRVEMMCQNVVMPPGKKAPRHNGGRANALYIMHLSQNTEQKALQKYIIVPWACVCVWFSLKMGRNIRAAKDKSRMFANNLQSVCITTVIFLFHKYWDNTSITWVCVI